MGYGSRVRAALVTALVAPALLGLPARSGAAPPGAPGYVCPTVATPAQPGQTKIMIAGDSVTNESSGDYTWRYRLWNDLTQDGDPVNFVGTFSETLDPVTLANGGRRFADCAFDMDHESRPGAKLLNFGGNVGAFSYYPDSTSWIRGAVARFDPDVLLLFAGTNDLLRITDEVTPAPSDAAVAQIVIDRAKKVVDQARLANPDVEIFFMRMLPANPQLTPNSTRFTAFNQKIDQIAADRSWEPVPGKTTFHLVTPPDFTGAGQTWDGGHPDALGEVAIAKAFANAIHAVLPALPGATTPSPQPAIGPRVPATLILGTVAPSTVGLTWTNGPGAGRTQVFVRDVTAGVPVDPDGGWTKRADIAWQAFYDVYKNKAGVGLTGSCVGYCTQYTLTGLTPQHTYQVRLRSAKGLAVAADLTSNVVTATTLASGTVAKVLTKGAVGISHGVTLSWSPVVEASGYRVYWRKHGTTTWSGPAATNAITFSRSITGLVAGTTYDLAVSAVTPELGEGEKSAALWASAKYYVLAAVPRPKVRALAGHKLRATWVRRTYATRYLVQVRLGTRLVRSAFVTRPTWTSGRLKKGKKYSVRVRPYDAAYGGRTSAAGTVRVR